MNDIYWTRIFSTFVEGIPAPQGSKRGFSKVGTTKVQLVEASTRVKPWREAIAAQAAAEFRGDPLTVPVMVETLFLFDRPKTATRPYPCTRNEGDLDKLERAVFDALVMGWVLLDDSLVVEGHSSKRYGGTAGVFVTVHIEN